MSRDIIAIVNTYSPRTGANIAQLVLYTDGSLGVYGDESMMRHSLGKLVAAQLPPQEPPASTPPSLPLKRPRGRPRKIRPS